MNPHSLHLEELYRTRFEGFQKALSTITGSYDTAGEALQEGFARALARIDTFRGQCPLGAWLWTIAVNVALEQRRGRERRDRHHVDGPLLDADAAVDEPKLVDAGHDPALVAALHALPARRRLMVFLRFFADCSYAEIAAICEVSEGTVGATLAQALESLRDALVAESRQTA
jgi:RNA polymerase sigma-70 factor (ECF subfamily)